MIGSAAPRRRRRPARCQQRRGDRLAPPAPAHSQRRGL